MRAVAFGILVLGGLLAWEAVKGLKSGTPASAATPAGAGGGSPGGGGSVPAAVPGLSSGLPSFGANPQVGQQTGLPLTLPGAFSAGPPAGTVVAPPGPAGGVAADVASNVRQLIAWAHEHGIDPRVALAIMGAESQGHSDAFNPEANNPMGHGGDAGPLQINGVNAPGGVMTDAFRALVANIQVDLAIIGWRWVRTPDNGGLLGLSFAQFLTDPLRYWSGAQGGQQGPEELQNLQTLGIPFANQWCPNGAC